MSRYVGPEAPMGSPGWWEWLMRVMVIAIVMFTLGVICVGCAKSATLHTETHMEGMQAFPVGPDMGYILDRVHEQCYFVHPRGIAHIGTQDCLTILTKTAEVLRSEPQ